MSTPVQRATLAALLCCMASIARAHAPLPRGLAVSPGGPGIAVHMPGFGLLLRSERASGFRYACDALLGVRPEEERVAMAYRGDGALLVGSAAGVRIVGADGCPASAGPALSSPVAVLVLAASAPDRAYAVTEPSDAPHRLVRSDDGGSTWSERAALGLDAIAALVVDDDDADRVYVSTSDPSDEATLLLSSDGGDSFDSFPQGRALTLLRAQSARTRLWAMARVPNQGVGVSILRAPSVEGPWSEVLRVNFFGGLAIDPDDPDTIWVGDEARGIFRSTDGGDSFEETQPSIAASCLGYGAGTLWACTPGLPADTALASSPDALAAFEPVMAFTEVDQLVDCPTELDVAHTCQAAWVEWQRDVLGVVPVVPDAGATLEPDAGRPVEPDAMIPAEAADAAVDAAGAPGSGCSATGTRSSSPRGWLPALCVIALRAARRRPRGCARRACPRTAAHPRERPAPAVSCPRSRRLARSSR